MTGQRAGGGPIDKNDESAMTLLFR